MKRVGLHEFLDLDCDLGPLATQGGELLSQAWQHRAGGVGADHDHGLLRERLFDLGGEAAPHPRGELDEAVAEPGFAGGRHLGGGRVVLEQVEDRRTVQVRAEDSFQGGWICVRRPRRRLLVAVTWPATSSSNPQSIVSSATCSSASCKERSACGIVRAASAMMNASRASVLASPGCRSAMRRIARPGK